MLRWLLLILLGLLIYSLVKRRDRAIAPGESEGTVTPVQEPIAPREMASIRPITRSEEKTLRDCFPWSVYYLQNIDYRPQAILCRGKLRAVPEEAYQTIATNIRQAFGDRFLVVFQESLRGHPFFALVPNAQATQKLEEGETLQRPGLAAGLMLLTLLTTTVVGAAMSGQLVDEAGQPITEFNAFIEALQSEPLLLLAGLPYSLGLMAILGFHEFSHYLTAVYYKIRTTLPYFIPFPIFLGTFGAFVQMRSPIPNRKALFDVSIAGPLGGLVVTVPLLLWGLSRSEVVPLEQDQSLLDVDALNPRFSLLLALLSKLALGSQLEPNSALDLDLLAVSGYIGLIVTALNLMPVGSLDGGHIVHAIYGQRTAVVVGHITRLLMFLLAIARPELLPWAIFLLLMPLTDQPALNDVSELDDRRDLLGLLSLVLLVAILLPLPRALALWLQI